MINNLPGVQTPPWNETNLPAYFAQIMGGFTAIQSLISFFNISNSGIKPDQLVSWPQINNAARVLILASSDPNFQAQNIVQMWQDVENLVGQYGAVVGALIAPHQQQIYNLFKEL